MLAAIRKAALRALAVATGLFFAITAGQAAAHHSTAMFDRTKNIDMKGVIQKFNWVNPHISFVFVAENSNEAWNVESSSPGVLGRMGWTRKSLNPGDQIEITLSPHRDGGPAGSLVQVKNLTTGAVLRKSN